MNTIHCTPKRANLPSFTEIFLECYREYLRKHLTHIQPLPTDHELNNCILWIELQRLGMTKEEATEVLANQIPQEE